MCQLLTTVQYVCNISLVYLDGQPYYALLALILLYYLMFLLCVVTSDFVVDIDIVEHDGNNKPVWYC